VGSLSPLLLTRGDYIHRPIVRGIFNEKIISSCKIEKHRCKIKRGKKKRRRDKKKENDDLECSTRRCPGVPSTSTTYEL
tara:strand:- start:603 stop:839 length:237 start_codon:yes stop_codon:yes gene_type:complete